MQRLSLLFTIVFAVPLLSACGEKLPDVTDEQILLLLGSDNWSGDDAPLTISKTRLECARLLSGLDDEIYVDFPVEMMGAFKTDCRVELTELIEDPDRNTAGFILENFESAELGKRITQVRSDADEKAKAARTARIEREKAEKLAARRKKVLDSRTLVESIVAALDSRISTLKDRCQTWGEEADALKKRNRRSQYSSKRPRQYCKESYFQNIRLAAQRASDSVAELEKSDLSSSLGVPGVYLGFADPKVIEERLIKLDQEIEQFRSSK